ncbi:junctional cadherin 5-associated protein-like [Entelurus aequoreus]|uniref:junctional cadherin 5-associated protein-like n=1 Tax=Entelurus aequoreus TaxID=161455 RepID=UPI002B1CF7D1|nr:junctional cadherin 5-associated protein-like [Entelurus aequoreus]XP_061877720.1 junctional cadherin 5-associated protein-like [Entelurus aequoreus]XP_061877721.1 junctional cadherin 5-associated protein-like [Entelurus aequoreus]XP_061877722.1 junctional cadherin 5-associated protein-like [Entelurus aequoreus]
MYSVEDLLISHGYKLPKNTASSTTPTPTPTPASSSSSSSRQAPSSSPPSYSKHHESSGSRPSSRAVNGYERGSRVTFSNNSQAYEAAAGCPNNNGEPRDRSQSRQEGEAQGQVDIPSYGDSLTSDSGLCDGSRGQQMQSKDVSFWRRRGQDFTVLLDYADLRDPHASGHGDYKRPQGPQQARGQELSAEERQRVVQERQRWAAQVQARAKEREAALNQWRLAAERKCQSLGTDEWRPTVSFSRQMSQNEGERWALEQQRLHARTPEGMVVHPRTKAKSQSMPRMLRPGSLQYVDVASCGQELYRRVNGHPLSHHDLYRAPRWPENDRPASANQLSLTPKPRFTRPPRPPSYEMHQQIRGSCEVLSGRDSVISQTRDRTPLPILRTGEAPLDYFAQESGPPGYNPPPSYKRAPVIIGGHRGFGEIAVDYRYRGDVYQHIHVAPDGSHWITRHPAGSWSEPPRERCMAGQKQLHPLCSMQVPGGGVQYISFNDPRIRHISSALGGNSLTDADKIRHIRNELPSTTVSEPASGNSAFLPPSMGPFITAKLAGDVNQTSSCDFDNDNKRWHSNLHKETVDNFSATDQNCNTYSKNQHPPPLPSSAFQAPIRRASSRQGSSLDQVFAETITQVKKIVPESGLENNRSTKRRVSETIFCLVSVPLHTPTNLNKDSSADQNNNDTKRSLTMTNTGTFAVGLKETHSLRSKSVNEMPIKLQYSHFHTSSTSSLRNSKRAPLRKEIIDAWALQASDDRERCYAGSWPGNQYRNQETQTGSPLTVVKSPEPQSPPGVQEPIHSVLDRTTDSGVGTDNGSAYGYPMAGQKDLHPSSNSAFSRLSNSPTPQQSLKPTEQHLTSPFKKPDQRDQNPSSPKRSNSTPPECSEQVAFGQFLLKPVNRRPFDAIGELESINKEMEDTISKRPHVGRSIDDLDGTNKRFNRYKPHTRFNACLKPGREGISLPPVLSEKTAIKVRSRSFPSADDLESMGTQNTFSRPQSNTPSTYKVCLMSNPDERPPRSLLPQHRDSNQPYRQDIPVPQESLLRDVGLTVYTEAPSGHGETMQRSLLVPATLDHKDLSVQLLSESGTALVENTRCLEHNSSQELKAEADTETNTSLDKMRQCKEQLSLKLGEDDGDEKYRISEPVKSNESTMADKHLETLLIHEQANALPTEDLSGLYDVKCAKGIPENESIEQRAARILGITIPVGALGASDSIEEYSDDIEPFVAEKPRYSDEDKDNVIEEPEQVEQESVILLGADIEEAKLLIREYSNEDGRQKHSYNHDDGEHNEDNIAQPGAVLDLPEFPPSNLPLSLPVSPDEKLAHKMGRGEKKGCGGASKLIESLQDKLSSSASASAASLGRSTIDRMARLKELDSVSRIRRLSLKGADSIRECENEESGRENLVRDDSKVVEELEDEGLKEQKGGKKDVDYAVEQENSCETHIKMVALQECCQSDEDICKVDGKPKEAEQTNDVFALKTIHEGREDVEVKGDEKVQLEVVANADKHEQNAAEVSRCEKTNNIKVEKVPKAKRRTKLQKPPLLPKPRSVPKREISLPLSFSSGTFTSSNMEEEEELHTVSDSYDPSRVERV